MMIYKFLNNRGPANGGVLGARQVRVVATTDTQDRAGDIMVPSGAMVKDYLTNPIVLWNHDRALPVGTAQLIMGPRSIEAVITFAEKGTSVLADEICALVKNGTVRAVSIGFSPIEGEPLGTRGYRYTKWELREISFCSVPANPEAIVIDKSNIHRTKAGRVLSAANSSALSGMLGHLQASQDLHDEATTLLDKSDQHRRKARRLGASIMSNAAISADDEPDSDDGDPNDSSAADIELSAFSRRKRLVESNRRVARSDELAFAKRQREIEILAMGEPPLTNQEKSYAKRLREIDILRFSAPV